MHDSPWHDEVFAGEVTDIRERLIVSPCSGRFVPLGGERFTSNGEWVEAGEAVAEVASGQSSQKVCTHARGWVMGMLAVPGQPVRRGDALFWIRSN